MGMITLIAGAACLLYYAVIAVYAGIDVNFGWFWIGLGCAFIIVHFTEKSRSRIFHLGGRLLLAAVILGLLILSLQCVHVISGMRQKEVSDVEYAIVLGAEVKGTRPSRSLLMRLEKAAEYGLENPGTILILSGGQGNGEDISEAQCMYNYLTEKGISPDRLYLEEKSTTTNENIRFSEEIIKHNGLDPRLAIATDWYHEFRAGLICSRQGFTCGAVSADTPHYLTAHLVTREIFAIANEVLFKR